GTRAARAPAAAPGGSGTGRGAGAAPKPPLFGAGARCGNHEPPAARPATAGTRCIPRSARSSSSGRPRGAPVRALGRADVVSRAGGRAVTADIAVLIPIDPIFPGDPV